MQIEHQATVQLDLDITWGDIKQKAEEAGIPDEAKLSVDKYVGDQHDPGYSKVTWKWATGGTGLNVTGRWLT